MAQHDKLDDELDAILDESVPLISPEALHRRIQSKDVTLLDIRTAREQEVSHIRGALKLSYEDFKREDVASLSREDTVVLYCAVGYRSEKIGEQLQEMGFKHVYNLYGGIFEWKNEGFEVVSENGTPTDSVHTYSEEWSKYLKKGTKVYE